MIVNKHLINDSEGWDVLLFSDLCLKMLAVQVDMHVCHLSARLLSSEGYVVYRVVFQRFLSFFDVLLVF